ENQERSRWDRAKIEEGIALLRRIERPEIEPGFYSVQAAIAAVHASAVVARDTDWRKIAKLYGLLAQLRPSPVIELNRAVAVAMAEGPEKGLALMEKIELPGYHWLLSARADLLRRLGRKPEAAAAYREALTLVGNAAERRFLERRLAEVS